MSNLFRNLQPSAKLHKNGFDLSQRHIFTSAAGELLPSLCIDCVPNDVLDINLANFVRTMPLNTAAYTRIKWYHHFFFVPYSILWQNWDSFITQRANNYSANSNGSKFVPYFRPKEVAEYLNGHASYTDLFGYQAGHRFAKLADLLGYGNLYPGEYGDQEVSKAANVNIFRIAAYNKIWYDYYRNPYYDNEENISRLDYVLEWNFDDLECRTAADAFLDIQLSSGIRNNSSFLSHMFTPKYRQWKKDILTSLLPDTQFGAVSFVPIGDNVNDPFTLYVNGVNPFDTTKRSLQVSNNGNALLNKVDTPNGQQHFTADNLGFDVLQLRKAEMLQRWRETTLRAGQQALKQFDAHFGIRPRHTVDHTAEFIGGVDQIVDINEVVTTANDSVGGTTTDKGAGEIYGRGVSSANGHINFKASEFGVLMCISSFMPEADYRAIGIDKNNQLFEPFDFFTPEFQNIGLEGVPYSQFYSDGDLEQDRNTIVGYAPRYWQYKTAMDKLHCGFIDSDDIGFGNWVTPRTHYQENFSQGLTRKALYIDPQVLNPIFSVAYNGTVDTDQFLCNDYFDIKAIRPMSILGLPNF